MKRLLLLTLLFFFALSAQAQDKKNKKTDKEPKEPKHTRAEKKEFRRKAAELRKEFKEQYGKDPEKFKEFKKNNAEAKKEAAKLDAEVTRLRQNEGTQKEQVETLKQMNAEDEAKIKELQEAIKKRNGASNNGNPTKTDLTIPTSGIFYAVHIGETNPEMLGKILENGLGELRNTQDAAGHNFYVLGLFPNVQAAHALKHKIMSMGIRQANVVTIKDGKLSL